MSVSNLSFSATLPPFHYTNDYNTNFSNSNISATGNVQLSRAKDATTGQTSTAVTSSITSNGLNFTENSASINGNILTVNYQSSNAANSAQDSGVAKSLLSANINGGGISFTPQSSITSGNQTTINYDTSPNRNFNLFISGAATSSATSSNAEHIELKSLSLVGNAITATYQLTTGGLPNNTTLAPHSAPQTTNIATVTAPSPSKDSAATFFTRGIGSIGDVLAGANGFTAAGFLAAASQIPGHGLLNGIPHPNALLAATLNPRSNVGADASFSVSDFVNTSANAFPTSNINSSFANAINAYTAANNNAPSDFANSSASGSGNSSSGTSGGGGGSYSGSYSTPASQAGAYSAISNASASTIRGSGYNSIA